MSLCFRSGVPSESVTCPHTTTATASPRTPTGPNYYTTSQQIHEHMHHVADKYDCKRYIKLKHSIQGAMWSEETAKWELEVKDGESKVCRDNVDVFINAGGVLK